MSKTNELKPTALKASGSKPSVTARPRFHLCLLLAFLLSTLSLCSSSEESLIIDPISSGGQEGPLSVTSTAQPQPHRQLVAKEGDVSLLVVRVSGRDRSPSMDNASLYNSIFVKEASLKQQYNKCSAGKLNVVPTDKGVLEVRVNMNINGADAADVVNAADIAGLAQLTTNLRNYADLTMYVVPQGTARKGDFGWTAYAVIDGKMSVINDDRANFLGVQMHELGHNFGLNHADGIDDPFGDLTSNMSRILLDHDFPIKCFNAQNHWHLGWYRDRSITVDPDVPVKINILGFVDYKKAIQGAEVVVAKVGENLYLQFNRAKLHNIDTEEAPDKLVIVLDRDDITDPGTTLVAKLDSVDKLFTAPNFENSGRQLNVEVCRVVMGETVDNVDWMEVSIGYGASLCGVQPSPRPSPGPSPRPSPVPLPRQSPSPSPMLADNSIHLPSPKPSLRPTIEPRPRPSHRPSAQPSPQPTPRPSVQSVSTIPVQYTPSSPEPTTTLYAEVAGRFKDRAEQSAFGGNPPSRVADRLNNIREDVDDQSGGTAGLGNNLVVYTMVAMIASVVATMLW
jgi:hypothetical protein